MENKTFIIAELSANHGGSIDIAKQTIRAAKRAGADAIKLQTYTADTITTNGKQDHFKIVISLFPASLHVCIANSISSKEAIPVEIIIGFLFFATYSIKGISVISKEAIL